MCPSKHYAGTLFVWKQWFLIWYIISLLRRQQKNIFSSGYLHVLVYLQTVFLKFRFLFIKMNFLFHSTPPPATPSRVGEGPQKKKLTAVLKKKRHVVVFIKWRNKPVLRSIWLKASDQVVSPVAQQESSNMFLVYSFA